MPRPKFEIGDVVWCTNEHRWDIDSIPKLRELGKIITVMTDAIRVYYEVQVKNDRTTVPEISVSLASDFEQLLFG